MEHHKRQTFKEGGSWTSEKHFKIEYDEKYISELIKVKSRLVQRGVQICKQMYERDGFSVRSLILARD